MSTITEDQLTIILGGAPMLCDGCGWEWFAWQRHDFAGCCRRAEWQREMRRWDDERGTK